MHLWRLTASRDLGHLVNIIEEFGPDCPGCGAAVFLIGFDQCPYRPTCGELFDRIEAE
jgi:hypothetical protein